MKNKKIIAAAAAIATGLVISLVKRISVITVAAVNPAEKNKLTL